MYIFIGVDELTGAEVAIKFAKTGSENYLKREYDNYLNLGADGQLLYL